MHVFTAVGTNVSLILKARTMIVKVGVSKNRFGLKKYVKTVLLTYYKGKN